MKPRKKMCKKKHEMLRSREIWFITERGRAGITVRVVREGSGKITPVAASKVRSTRSFWAQKERKKKANDSWRTRHKRETDSFDVAFVTPAIATVLWNYPLPYQCQLCASILIRVWLPTFSIHYAEKRNVGTGRVTVFYRSRVSRFMNLDASFFYYPRLARAKCE